MKMFTLIKRETKSLFCNPLSLAVISVLNIVPTVIFAVFLKVNQTQSGYAGFENIVSLMALIFAFAIPTVTIITTCKEKKSGSEEFLYSMAVTRCEAVLAKIFAYILFFALPTAILAMFPPIFAGFGSVNFLHCYLSLLILEAFEIFAVTFSVMLAQRLGKVIVSLVISYTVFALSFVLGVLSVLVRFIPLGTQFDKIFGGILLELSFFKKVDTVVYELFDWTVLAFFVIGIIVFTVMSIVDVKRKLAPVLTSLLLVACIGILPVFLPYSVRQIDLNVNKLYTPSSSTKDYLSEIDEEITVYLIDPYTNEQELYNAIVRTVEAGNNIDLKIVNSAEDKDFLEKYGLENEAVDSLAYAMIIESPKRWSFINGSDYFSYYNRSMGYLSTSELQYRYTSCMMFLNQYSAYYDKLSDDSPVKDALQKCSQILESLQNETLVCLQLEDVFADAIAYVTADMIPTVYFLTGHGEEGTSANPYDFKKNGKFPENADMIVINSPNEDYSESEIDTLINYVDNGGKLYILADIDNYSMPNFMQLLARYGLSVENSVISVDEKTVVPVSVDKSHEAFSSMSANEVTVKDVSKIKVAEDTKYSYHSMLTYKHTEGEGEDAIVEQYPVAISVSEGKDKKITLFTGATTFNSSDNGLSEEELERVSPCVTNVMSWMFDEFESGISKTPPKLYQKTLYIANNGQIVKTVIAFLLVAIVITVSLSAYMLSRSLRSKRLTKKTD